MKILFLRTLSLLIPLQLLPTHAFVRTSPLRTYSTLPRGWTLPKREKAFLIDVVVEPSKHRKYLIQQLDSGGDSDIPKVLVPWVTVYRFMPKLSVGKLDVSFTLASAILFACLDYATADILCTLGWPSSTITRQMAGSVTTIFHSTVLVLGLGACLGTQRFVPSERMEAHPPWWRDSATALLQFCTGYMFYDALVQYTADRWVAGVGPLWSMTDKLFLAHHAITALYMTSTRLIGAGHMSAMVLMFFGEITAPIMNVLRIANLVAKVETIHAAWLQVLHPYVEHLFAALYLSVRVLVGPVCGVRLTYDLLFTKRGRKNVPVLLSLGWLTACWGVLMGSVPWVRTCLRILKGTSSSLA